jgi:hypothetical protein
VSLDYETYRQLAEQCRRFGLPEKYVPLVCAYCEENWGQVVPVLGPQNICHQCTIEKLEKMLNAENPILARVKE